MNSILHLLFYFMLFTLNVFCAYHGVCSVNTESGNYRKVCCTDFEEIDSKCKPCPTGSMSQIGQNCRPCPPKTFGILCSGDCYCNEFERCDHVVGCVEKMKKESSTEVYQISSYIPFDFQNSSWLMKVTSGNPNTFSLPGLSSREVIVYCTLSAAVLILLILSICLCVVLLKHKRRLSSINNSNLGRESTNQTIEDNNDQPRVVEFNLYDEIVDADLSDIQVNPQLINNDYLDVVVESLSFKSCDSGQLERNSYLNPYQPCVSDAILQSSYEDLQMQTIITPCNNEITAIDL